MKKKKKERKVDSEEVLALKSVEKKQREMLRKVEKEKQDVLQKVAAEKKQVIEKIAEEKKISNILQRMHAWERFKEQITKPVELGGFGKNKKSKAKRDIEKHSLLKRTLIRAGVEVKPDLISKWILRIAGGLEIIVFIFLVMIYGPLFTSSYIFVTLIVAGSVFASFLAIFFLNWVLLFAYLDFRSYKRKIGVEEVLPDFLLLASANIRAGMPIDRALWYAVRPRFGVLAKEMEIVAKETMSGEDLEQALQKFADKYDSILLNNTTALLIEGIKSGGELAGLLSKISQGIQDNKILKKEMAAGISAYAIFIMVSAVLMAPLLYALASQLLTVISDITSNANIGSEGGLGSSFVGGGVGVTQQDFLIFAFSNLFFTSLLSAMIVSIIKKGNVKSGLRLIPIYILVSMTFFWLAFKAFSAVFGSFI